MAKTIDADKQAREDNIRRQDRDLRCVAVSEAIRISAGHDAKRVVADAKTIYDFLRDLK